MKCGYWLPAIVQRQAPQTRVKTTRHAKFSSAALVRRWTETRYDIIRIRANQSLIDRVAGAKRDCGFAPFPSITEDRMKKMTDNELTHVPKGMARPVALGAECG
jgi:hypothetical protein